MDPTEAVQVALAAALTGAQALAAASIRDPIAAQGAPYPLVEIGQSQWVPDNNGCLSSGLDYETVHVWASDAMARLTAKTLAAAVAAVVAPAAGPTWAPAGWSVISAILEDAHHGTDGDATDPKGLVAHSVLTFRIRLQPAG